MGADDLWSGAFAADEMYGDVYLYPVDPTQYASDGNWTGGSDLFIFEANNGNDIIGDFVQGQDNIVLSGIPGVADFAQLSSLISVLNPYDSLITFSAGNTITVWDTVIAGVSTLASTDFTFLAPS
jgi:hypothetical protein